MCTYPINPMGIYFLCCVHDNKRIGTHDVVRNTFATIVWDVSFHVRWKQLHELLSNMFNSSCWRIDITLTKDDICILINIVVVIVDSTQVNLFLQSCATQWLVGFDAAQAKERNYLDWQHVNQFLPLVVDAFGYLHKQAYVFLHNCANVIWSLKRLKGLPHFVLVISLRQESSITLQKLQASPS